MKRVFKEAVRLTITNATHRKGFRLLDISPKYNVEYAIGECEELLSAKLRDHQLEELADAFNCLTLYAAREGFTEHEIEDQMLNKLCTRFNVLGEAS